MAFIVELAHTSPEIISLATARKQLQLEADFIEDDALITAYIDAAISEAEHFINSEIAEKKFQIKGKSFADALAFNKQIIQAVDAVKYKDAAGEEQVIAADKYYLQTVDKYENKIEFAEDYEFPIVKEYDPNAVEINVTVGYAAGKVPKAIQQALLLMVSHSYEHRVDTVKEKCTAAEVKLQKFRRY